MCVSMLLSRTLSRSLSRRGFGTRASTIADVASSLHRLKPAESRFVLPASTPISVAAQHLINERLTFALVANDVHDGAVSGMITERNLLRYAMHAGDLAFFSGQEREPTLAPWMTPKEEMLSVRLDDTIAHAASLLQHGIWRHCPVLDYWGKLHSVMDVRDVALSLIEETGGEIGAWKGKSAADLLGDKRRRALEKSTDATGSWREQLEAYLLQHAGTHTISARASVEEAARQCLDARLTFLVAIEPGATRSDDRVVGLVSERSFVSFCASGNPVGSTPGGHTPVSSIMTPLAEVCNASSANRARVRLLACCGTVMRVSTAC